MNKEILKELLIDCLLFQKPFDGEPIPNWMFAVSIWFSLGNIIYCIIHHHY